MRKLVKWLAIAVVIAAVFEEFRKPRDQRTGTGRVWNFVPYDFRMPTPERIRARMWNPTEERVVTETPFGVGWTVNLARVAGMDSANGATEF